MFTIGYELEYEKVCFFEDNYRIYPLLNKFGNIKQDSSLEHGFELASNIERAHSFKSDSIDKRWASLFRRLNRLPIRSQANTGMHIHVGRTALTLDQIYKVNDFVYSQYSLDTNIGERDANRWCFFHKNTLEHLKKDSDPEKFRFLNVLPLNTIEFRFFKSPTTCQKFLVNMQYVISIIEYVYQEKSKEGDFRSKCLFSPRSIQEDFFLFLINSTGFNDLRHFLSTDVLLDSYVE